ncbi:MAG: class I SAM-dependent methyltransferase [Clostridia bacterium]
MKITKQHIDNAKKPTGEMGIKTLERMNHSHENLTNWALSFLTIEKPNKVLDIGCGGGATIKRLFNKYAQSFIYGIDYSHESIQLSKLTNEDILNKSCEISWGDVHELAYEDETFDVITAFETVYFWNDLSKALSEVNRVLSENGEFLICCESSNSQNEVWQDVLGELRIFSAQEWKSILENNNFNVKKIRAENEWICLICSKKLND